jgi:3-oxoadipate enol-lactonase
MRVEVSDITFNILDDGPKDGPAVVFIHPLGTNLRIWNDVCAQMPKTLRLIRYDTRGHGASDVPPAPYSMGQLIRDAEQILDHLNIKDCVCVGAGLGGLIAQGLAVKRLDQIRAIVLCGTAAKIGTPAQWAKRIQQIETKGLPSIASTLSALNFRRAAQNTPLVQFWTNALAHSDPIGYNATCTAISGTDFYTPTSGLRLPTLGLCGIDDRVTPPDLMRETIDLIPGAQFELLRRAGHFPMIETPDAFAAHLNTFLREISHA